MEKKNKNKRVKRLDAQKDPDVIEVMTDRDIQEEADKIIDIVTTTRFVDEDEDDDEDEDEEIRE